MPPCFATALPLYTKWVKDSNLYTLKSFEITLKSELDPKIKQT